MGKRVDFLFHMQTIASIVDKEKKKKIGKTRIDTDISDLKFKMIEMQTKKHITKNKLGNKN